MDDGPFLRDPVFYRGVRGTQRWTLAHCGVSWVCRGSRVGEIERVATEWCLGPSPAGRPHALHAWAGGV